MSEQDDQPTTEPAVEETVAEGDPVEETAETDGLADETPADETPADETGGRDR